MRHGIRDRQPIARDMADEEEAHATFRDRRAAARDYVVNLRAEPEIMRLHERIDTPRIEHLRVLPARQREMPALLAAKS